MKARLLSIILRSLSLVAVATVATQARSADEFMQFPKGFDKGVHYGTVTRGTLREELYTSHAALDAAKKGEPLPDGTIITLVDFRDGKLHRYVVMEKRKGFGAAVPTAIRAGDWKFQEFNADESVNRAEDGSRCMQCHKGQERQDFVFTANQMKSARVEASK